jgi:hypothetical protein
MAVIFNYSLINYTGWHVTLCSSPLSTMGNSCELNAPDWCELKLGLTECVLCMQIGGKKNFAKGLQALFHSPDSAAFI